MKFRDKDGNVFEDIQEIGDLFCDIRTECECCPIGQAKASQLCGDWCNDHPAEAARLMGYEVVEDEKEENMKPKKPLKDWTLEEAQAFCEQQKRCNDCTMRKREIAACKMAGPACKWDLTDKPRFTDKEMEVFKVFYKNGIKAIRRNEHGGLIFDGSIDMFPSLKPGETVRLKDIMGEQVKGGA